jgi:hypothetical protein
MNPEPPNTVATLRIAIMSSILVCRSDRRGCRRPQACRFPGKGTKVFASFLKKKRFLF